MTFLSHHDTGVIRKQLWPKKPDLKWCHAESVSLERETVNLIKDQLLWGQVQELSAV